MKRSIIIFAATLFLMAGCSKKQNTETVKNQKNQTEEAMINDNLPDNPLTEVPKKIDLDFTKMNYNMASSVMFEMMVEPEKYADKTVKITGQFNTSIYEGTRYFAVINWDSTGCCPAGLDFIPPSKMSFPEDFPEDGTFITVTGTMRFDSDREDRQLYFFAASVTS